MPLKILKGCLDFESKLVNLVDFNILEKSNKKIRLFLNGNICY